MKPVPILLVITVGAALGIYLAWRVLRGERGRPAVIGAHVILGVIGLEGVAMLIMGAPNGADPATGQLVRSAGLFLVLAVMSGFATPVENMPTVLQWLAQVIPLTHFLIIVEGSFLKAMPPADIFASLWPLAVIAAVTLSMATALVRGRLQ